MDLVSVGGLNGIYLISPLEHKLLESRDYILYLYFVHNSTVPYNSQALKD